VLTTPITLPHIQQDLAACIGGELELLYVHEDQKFQQILHESMSIPEGHLKTFPTDWAFLKKHLSSFSAIVYKYSKFRVCIARGKPS
jgi:hypothetical protein